MIPFGPERLRGCVASRRAALVSSCHASWFLHRLLSSSHCAALSLSCLTSWLLHHLLPSSHCAALLLSCRASCCIASRHPLIAPPLVNSSRQLVVALPLLVSRCTPCHPLVLSSRRLIVLSPLDALPSRVSSSHCVTSHCLVAPAGCHAVISCCPLVAPPSRPLIVC